MIMRNLIIFLLFVIVYSCTDTSTLPVVITSPVSDIKSSSALCGGTIVSNGKDKLSNQGICWSVKINPTILDNYICDSTKQPSFTVIITGLESNTSYHIRSFATNSMGTGYGSNIKIITMSKNVIVLVGDSRTDGWNCKDCYPYMDLLNLKESSVIYKTSFGGASSDSLIARYTDVDRKFSNLARLNVVVVWIGVNDIAVNDKSAEYTYNNLVEYCTERRNKGWKVIACTEISMKGIGSNGICDLTRNIFNALIKTHWRDFSDGVADLASYSEIGQREAYLNTTYFCDQIHLTNSGTTIVAGIINRAIDKLMENFE